MRNFSRPRRIRPGRRRVLPSAEVIERRLLLTTYTVTTTADAGRGSLRDAINQVNNDDGPDVIDFKIGNISEGGGTGSSQSILTLSPLPAIFTTVTIDGTTQAGYTGTPLIVIDGKNSGQATAPGLEIEADNSVVKGLAVVDSTGAGISINGANGVQLLANDVGVIRGTGSTRPGIAPNNGPGIAVAFSTGDQIGLPGLGNLIGGNVGSGISVASLSSSLAIEGNAIGALPIADNQIGIGPQNYGNGGDGIILTGAPSVTVGGSAVGVGNLISGNAGNGIHIVGGSGGISVSAVVATGDLIQGNRIGTSFSGARVIGNGIDGIRVDASPHNTIGGTAPGAGNLISGNVSRGITIDQPASLGNLIAGNSIGLDLTGLVGLSNASDGIYLLNAPGTTIGGLAPGSSNAIAFNGGAGIHVEGAGAPGTRIVGDAITDNSGAGIAIVEAPASAIRLNLIGRNRLDGIAIQGATSSANLIRGNFIGISPAGVAMPNFQGGVSILDSAANTIGGASAADRNVISNNTGSGITLEGPGASGNRVLGNLIGTDPSGTGNFGNLLDGILIVNAPRNTIGGTTGEERNVISSNRSGINIQSLPDAAVGASSGLQGGLADSNLIQGNYIGLNATGEVDFGNFQDGIVITDGSFNTIGGTTFGAGNVISGNLADGIGIGQAGSPDPTAGNLIQGNIIGLDASATLRIGNDQNGIRLVIAPGATIGGSTPGSGNTISGNANGIDVFGSLGTDLGDLIQGNVVGLGGDGEQSDTTIAGLYSLKNTNNGIQIEQGAQGVTIGGTTHGAGNIISGNGSAGIRVINFSTGDAIEGNLIGVAADGVTPRANNESGVFLADQAAGITIGGSTPGAGNVISGNATGVTITNPGTSFNEISGNLIGLGIDGKTLVGNLGFGILLLDGAGGNLIGGDSPAQRNVISGNGQGVGIIGAGASGNLVSGNLIGLDATGSLPRGNLQLGVFINSSGGNTIGGTAFVAGNVISANTGVGIEVFGPGSTSNLVVGNIVGLDATGTRAIDASGNSLGNAGFGIQVQDAPGNMVGGDIPAARNFVSNNRQAGVAVSGLKSIGTFVSGNYIGVDATGRVALGNMADGVLIDNAPRVVVGGASPSASNVISGNANNGVEISGAGSAGDLILGDLIGTDASGLVALGNRQSGVLVVNAPGVVIGGQDPSIRDVISGNGRDGIRFSGQGVVGGQVLGDFIGVDASGRLALGNGDDGVLLDGAVGVNVGSPAPGAANVISANVSSGVEFSGLSTFGNAVEGNRIGTDLTASKALGNATGVFSNGSAFNQVGGPAPGSGNTISGNFSSGVHLFGPNSAHNLIEGNRIGTDGSGEFALPNLAGVFLDGSPGNLVLSNLLSGNTQAGAIIQGSAASGNLVAGNFVGVDAAGRKGIALATPQQSGVLILDAPANVVGGTTGPGRNVLSGNVVGVVVSGFNARNDLVVGNYIGTDAFGLVAVPNQAGVYLNGSGNNTIGGTTPGTGNLISGNTATGVDLYGTLASGNLVQGNVVGLDATESNKLPNGSGIYAELAQSNTIGGPTASAGNLISGNNVAGVYLFDAAAGNLVQNNRIGVTASGKPMGNGEYGILLYNAANNLIDKTQATGNLIANSGIGNFREFTGPAPTSSTTTTKSKIKAKSIAGASHPVGPKGISPRGSVAGSASTSRTGS